MCYKNTGEFSNVGRREHAGNVGHNKTKRDSDNEKLQLLNFKCPDRTRTENTGQGKVSLRSITLKNCGLLGTLRVENLAYEKYVFIRTTFDNWQTQHDVTARYLPGSSTGSTDTFTFELSSELWRHKGSDTHAELCICYQVDNRTFWDNNEGENFKISITS